MTIALHSPTALNSTRHAHRLDRRLAAFSLGLVLAVLLLACIFAAAPRVGSDGPTFRPPSSEQVLGGMRAGR
jgi:hypothetical protein